MKKAGIIVVAILVLAAIGYFGYTYYTDQTTYKTTFKETITLESKATPVTSFTELVSTSSVIVKGIVTDSGTYRITSASNNILENKEGVYTDYPIEGNDLRSSDTGNSIFVLSLDGGVKNEKKYMVLDGPIISKDQEYIVFAATNSDGLLRPLASGNAIATKLNDTTFKLPDNSGLPEDERTFTLDTLNQAIKK